MQKVVGLLRRLTDKETWIKMAQQSKDAAANDFNPELIQKEFEAGLVVKET
ncbi:MAG: hypothetical protein NC828_01880 [Candidatus Omnitrophica bacterium]|nr:hypothetical protein [Candidatus Omnitrophota bacterium]